MASVIGRKGRAAEKGKLQSSIYLLKKRRIRFNRRIKKFILGRNGENRYRSSRSTPANSFFFVEQTEQAKGCSVSFYQDGLLPLYKLYRLEHGVQEALQEKIWLRSGGFLVMQQTEAFVSVDVNSGKNSSKKQPEEFYRKLNKEAAAEIARQIRLRNLYGIILIDFINMKASESREELLHLMREYVNLLNKNDCCGCNSFGNYGTHTTKREKIPAGTVAGSVRKNNSIENSEVTG